MKTLVENFFGERGDGPRSNWSDPRPNVGGPIGILCVLFGALAIVLVMITSFVIGAAWIAEAVFP